MSTINEKNRWEIKKIGLLNYWWYDEEEFEFADGRLILRGTNGSGKSVTMQSFIPLLLDGNKSPERLDPFNTKARKIEDYVLGYGEDIKEENTSYLYMEFYKKETKNYLTIGMGLRGKRNNGVSFWGFCIKDGRRIGKDFLLYKDIGNKIPLTKQELKNRIAEGGQVVDTQKEYAMMVNNNIFGFQNYSEYQEFIKLLIEIRTPKLSKDGFKPSIITEIMANSLRPLSDEDLKAVSESIENMNKTKEQLEMLQISQKALKQLILPYDNYNKCILFNKVKKYNEKQKMYKHTLKESEELEEKIKNNQNIYEQIKAKKQEVEKQIEVYKYKEQELKTNELWKQKEEQAKMEKEIEEIRVDLKNKSKAEEDKKTVIRKKETEEKEAKEKYEIEKDNFKTIRNETEALARKIEYDEFFFKMDEIKLEEKYNYQYFKEDIKRYIEKIEKGKKALEQEQIINNEYEMALENLDREKIAKIKQEEQTDKSRVFLGEAKEEFIEQMYLWEKANELLKLNQEELTAISQKVQNYGENSEYGDIILELNKPYTNKNQEMLNIKATQNAKKENLDEKIKEITEKIEEWKNKKEPEPVRLEKIEQNRKRLKEKGIAFIELYNAIDFKKDVSEAQKGRIESALIDMGILDALIIPKEEQKKIKQIDSDFIDKYLFEMPVEFKHDLTEFLEVKLPENTKIKNETVYNILKSIMIEDMTASTYLNENGEYKIGIIKGIADKNEPARFIGSKARKEYKERQIKELEEIRQNVVYEKEKIENEIIKIDEKLQKIEAEYKKFPLKENLENAYNELRININKLSAIKENVIQLENILAEKFEKLKQAKEETQILTKNLRFSLTIESYTENLLCANELKDNIYEIEKYHNSIISEYEKLNTAMETLENLRYDLDEILYEKGKLNIKLQTLMGKLDVMRQMATGMEEIEKQMEECIEKLDKLPQEEKQLISDCAKTEAEIEKLNEINIGIGTKLIALEKQTNILRDILKQELDLKYVINGYDDIESVTSKILKEYSNFDKEAKGITSYYSSLIEKYQDNNEKLLDYNLSIGEIFNENIQEVDDEEIRQLQKTRTRNDIACFVNGKKVTLNILKEHIEETIEVTQNLVDDEDRNLFEEILIGAVGRKIRERIYSAKSWVESMNKLMKSLNTSSGLSFSLNWKPKLACNENELDTREIVDILNSDSGLLKQEDIKKVATHFRTKFAQAEKEFQDKGAIVPFYNIIKESLDYRTWFEFQFMYKKADEQSKELTNNAFFKLSGGEKAMAMYIPLFASVCARYDSARKYFLRIISLDEAFAGVDDNNIRDMFRILTELELEYVINSQVLWGEYDTVPSLAISELISDVNNKVVSVIRYHWDGKKRNLLV